MYIFFNFINYLTTFILKKEINIKLLYELFLYCQKIFDYS